MDATVLYSLLALMGGVQAIGLSNNAARIPSPNDNKAKDKKDKKDKNDDNETGEDSGEFVTKGDLDRIKQELLRVIGNRRKVVANQQGNYDEVEEDEGDEKEGEEAKQRAVRKDDDPNKKAEAGAKEKAEAKAKAEANATGDEGEVGRGHDADGEKTVIGQSLGLQNGDKITIDMLLQGGVDFDVGDFIKTHNLLFGENKKNQTPEVIEIQKSSLEDDLRHKLLPNIKSVLPKGTPVFLVQLLVYRGISKVESEKETLNTFDDTKFLNNVLSMYSQKRNQNKIDEVLNMRTHLNQIFQSRKEIYDNLDRVLSDIFQNPKYLQRASKPRQEVENAENLDNLNETLNNKKKSGRDKVQQNEDVGTQEATRLKVEENPVISERKEYVATRLQEEGKETRIPGKGSRPEGDEKPKITGESSQPEGDEKPKIQGKGSEDDLIEEIMRNFNNEKMDEYIEKSDEYPGLQNVLTGQIDDNEKLSDNHFRMYRFLLVKSLEEIIKMNDQGILNTALKRIEDAGTKYNDDVLLDFHKNITSNDTITSDTYNKLTKTLFTGGSPVSTVGLPEGELKQMSDHTKMATPISETDWDRELYPIVLDPRSDLLEDVNPIEGKGDDDEEEDDIPITDLLVLHADNIGYVLAWLDSHAEPTRPANVTMLIDFIKESGSETGDVEQVLQMIPDSVLDFILNEDNERTLRNLMTEYHDVRKVEEKTPDDNIKDISELGGGLKYRVYPFYMVSVYRIVYYLYNTQRISHKVLFYDVLSSLTILWVVYSMGLVDSTTMYTYVGGVLVSCIVIGIFKDCFDENQRAVEIVVPIIILITTLLTLHISTFMGKTWS